MCLFRKSRKTQTEESDISSKLKGIEGDIKAMRQKLDSLAEESDTSSKLENIDGQLETINKQLNNMAEDPKDKIYLQLHEQYAINNNANLGTIMALVIALIAVIGYFGFVFINSTSEFIDNSYDLYDPYKRMYSIEALILVYIASISILAILFCLCTYQGIAQRKEQFIIHAIRIKEYSVNNGILPVLYNPYRKKGFKIIQGLYGELVKIFIWVGGALSLAMIFRIVAFYFEDKAGAKSHPLELSTVLILVGIILAILLVIWPSSRRYYLKQYKSYISRQIEYSKKLEGVRIDDQPLDYLLTKDENGNSEKGEISRIEEAKFKTRKYNDIVKEWEKKQKTNQTGENPTSSTTAQERHAQ